VSKVKLVNAIDVQATTAVVTLRLVFGFDASTAAMIFHGIDPTSFRPDPRLEIPRCAFCGLDLRDAFDLVEITLSPPLNNETYFRQAHAACINDAFGRGAKVEFFVGTGIIPEERPAVREPGNAHSGEFQLVLDRIIESQQLDFADATSVEIAVIEVDHRDTAVVFVDADYLVAPAELDEILERA